MKSKQLANILIKIAGLYICLLAIPNTISGIIVVLSFAFGSAKWDEAVIRLLSYSIGTGVQAAVGIFIIVKSRNIAEFFFKNEDE
jgi:ABC-type nickel/cobalt efflux system permease component RcnA